MAVSLNKGHHYPSFLTAMTKIENQIIPVLHLVGERHFFILQNVAIDADQISLGLGQRFRHFTLQYQQSIITLFHFSSYLLL